MRLFGPALIATLLRTSISLNQPQTAPLTLATDTASAFSLWPRSSSLEGIFPRASEGPPPTNNSAPGGPADSALAQSNSSTFSTSFGYPSQNFTFSLTVNRNGNTWFRLAGPSWWSWIAVGTGTQMSGSMMFFVYQNNNNGKTEFDLSIARY
jgi:hypothetical protein